MSTVAVNGGVHLMTVADVGGSAVSGGEVFEGAGGIFVWNDDYAADGPGAFIYFGPVKLTKETGVAFTKGDQLYWDAANDRLDKTATNIPCGLAGDDAASDDTTAIVILGIGSGDS